MNLLRTPLTFLRALRHAFVYWREGKPVIAPAIVRAHRMRTCSECEQQRHQFCLLCNCAIAIKTKVASESCPHQPPKWTAL